VTRAATLPGLRPIAREGFLGDGGFLSDRLMCGSDRGGDGGGAGAHHQADGGEHRRDECQQAARPPGAPMLRGGGCVGVRKGR